MRMTPLTILAYNCKYFGKHFAKVFSCVIACIYLIVLDKASRPSMHVLQLRSRRVWLLHPERAFHCLCSGPRPIAHCSRECVVCKRETGVISTRVGGVIQRAYLLLRAGGLHQMAQPEAGDPVRQQQREPGVGRR